jgi:hypothetical protein
VRTRNPVEVLSGVHADMGHHAGQEEVLGRAQRQQGDRLALEVSDCVDTLVTKEFVTPGVHARQHEQRIPGVHTSNDEPGELHRHVCFASGHEVQPYAVADVDIVDIREALDL